MIRNALAAIVLLATLCSVFTQEVLVQRQSNIVTAAPVQVDIYVMSKCPDVRSFYAQIVGDLYQNLNSIMNISVYFIAKVDASQKYGFKSLHGDTEVLGDLFEACAQSAYKGDNKFFSMLMCVNDDMRNIPTNLQQCAQRQSMDYSKMKDCALGTQGKILLTQSISNTDARAVKWSPTMYLNGKEFCQWNGGPCSAKDYDGFVKSICDAYKGTDKPAACN